jgi:hypothetical protein
LSIIIVDTARTSNRVVRCGGWLARSRKEITVDDTNYTFLLVNDIELADIWMPCFSRSEIYGLKAKPIKRLKKSRKAL